MSNFSQSSFIQRDTDYFRENIGNITNAEDLVADRRLLTVALGAFGLQDDIDNKFFIQKMLGEGTTNEDSFANRFADTRYREFSAEFGLGPGEFRFTTLSSFPEKIVSMFERQSFEVAVGNQSEDLRIALTAERVFADIAKSDASEAGKWFAIMGDPPMRSLFETAFSLPTAFSQIDIDRQQRELSERSKEVFGESDPAAFNQPDLQEALLSRFTALSQLKNFNGGTSGASIALTLLQF